MDVASNPPGASYVITVLRPALDSPLLLHISAKKLEMSGAAVRTTKAGRSRHQGSCGGVLAPGYLLGAVSLVI